MIEYARNAPKKMDVDIFLLEYLVYIGTCTCLLYTSFFSCTTCIVYQYFKELAAFVLKAGAKVRGFILTTKCFRKFFSLFFFYRFSDSLSERERR